MASVPRILAVDSTNHIAGIIRGAMTLLNRRFVLVEVPAASDAIEELQNSSVDLLVTAFALPDSNGMELASRAIRESAGTPVIVLAGADDPEIDSQMLQNVSYTFLVRPVGEAFLRALRIGLDGEAAVTAQESGATTSAGLELGPVPDLEEGMLRNHLLTIMRDTVAMGGFIADRLGRVVFAEGMTGYFDIDVCAATLAPQFAHTATLRDLIGGYAWSLQYFDGDDYDLFGMSLGLHYFAVLIFDGSKRAQFGPVTSFGRKGAEAFAEEMGAEAWAFRRQISKITQTMPVITPNSIENVDTTSGIEIPEPSVSDSEQPTQPVAAQPPALELEPVENFDPDALFNQNVDESQFANLFGEDELQENTFISADHSVSFDEAMNMGILDE